jgi:hypothetical protein
MPEQAPPDQPEPEPPRIIHGDSLNELRKLADHSIDSWSLTRQRASASWNTNGIRTREVAIKGLAG